VFAKCHVDASYPCKKQLAVPGPVTRSQPTTNTPFTPLTLLCATVLNHLPVVVCLFTPCSKQLALLGPLRPQPTKIWKRKFVKLMVVGDSGLGKTTLISALLSKPGEQLQVGDRSFAVTCSFDATLVLPLLLLTAIKCTPMVISAATNT
jgi:hypothetical protein